MSRLKTQEIPIQFLKPLALWWLAGGGRDAPIRVQNCLDSIAAYFEGTPL